jgi:hypothetical protein
VLLEPAAGLREVHVGQAPVVRPASRDHHMVDRGRQVPEEPVQCSRISGVEDRCADRVEFERGVLEALGIAAGEDDVRPLSACPSGCFESDAGAAADHDHGLTEQVRFALGARDSGCGAHDSSDRLAGHHGRGLCRTSRPWDPRVGALV